jgi:hypothetical protein
VTTAFEVTRSHAAIGGTVTDSRSGAALAGATVEVLPLGVKASTGPDGFYGFLDLPPGTYSLRASLASPSSGYGSVTVGGVVVGTDPQGHPVLDGKASIALPPTRLIGIVKRADTQAPIAGAEVRVRTGGAVTRSNTLGQYVLTGVEAGAQSVRASAPGFATASVTITTVAGQDTSFDFALSAGQ